ncbi:ankyrin repeat domain-containing protein [Arsukibacterium indicum]|uniref:Ankyrin repeat domain-containing protein n=1 Tax=Arsukibacterium indicum TaxID=2848612 RepID=A0ABS6MGY4_9GAMM|nr:ankyrin repeat domain-containing protein [Arsukibacterium indicum]MBV2128083.1 ankyrin repeat domain-containing protein [Arsukibacterium indicum]
MSRFGDNIKNNPVTWIFTVVALVLLALIILWFWPEREQSETTSDLSSKSDFLQSSDRNGLNNSHSDNIDSNSAVKIDTSDYAQCQQFTREFRSTSVGWGYENHKEWDRYLLQGYSLDEITLAIEHFANSNFAARFRVEQLRKGTEISLTNQQLNEQLRQQFPELAGSGLSIQRAIPLPALAAFATMTAEEKQQVLSAQPLGVDDVAYFIHSGLPDDDIMMMLSHISDPAAMVSYERLEATSLLDFAVAASRPVLVKSLLQSGLLPSSDDYLGSSMEWALSRLSYADENAIQNAVEVVKLLKLYGATARFRVKSQAKIEGNFPRNYFQFTEQQILSILQDYQLDLTQIEQRQVFVLPEQHPLITSLEAQRDAFLTKQLSGEYPVQLIACERTLKSVNAQWQPESAHDVINRIEKLYNGSPELVISKLADIDPLLVDMYRERLDRLARPMTIISFPPEASALLQKGDIKQTIRYFEAQSYSDEVKRWLIPQLLGFNVEYYSEVRQSSLWLDDLQLSDLMLLRLGAEQVQALEHAGANLRGMDSRNKTLMHYAAEQSDVSLVSFLRSQGYPFSLDDQGQDPLHIVLRSDQLKLSKQKIESLVDVVMDYQPDIDAFHHSRMALIKLKYPQLYQSLIIRHPVLAVTAETPLPQVR